MSGSEFAGDETILARLLRHERTRGDETWAWFLEGQAERALTWGELAARARLLGEFLARDDAVPGETLFILAPLGPDILAAFLGAMIAGATPALLSYPSRKVAPDVYARNLRGVLETTGARRIVTTRGLEPTLRGALPPGQAVEWLEDSTAARRPARDALATAASMPAERVALLQHSSGSTGLQKGVALSHRAVLNQVRHYARAIQLDPQRDRVASWLPLYHDMGLIATFLMPLVAGVPVVYMDPFQWVADPALLLEAISRHRATLTWMPNFAYAHLAASVADSRAAPLDLSCMRGFVNCSEPVRESSHRVFLERFRPQGVRGEMLWACYAMAENTFAVTQAGGTSPTGVDWIDPAVLASERRAAPTSAGTGLALVSCGGPIEGCEVRIVDEARQPVPERTVGEVSLRSDSMLTEYHRNPDATARALEGGFYFTGDLGYLAAGQLYITGRKKDLIIVGGRNFYPQDIEHVVGSQAGVVPGRVAALGLEDPALGTEQVVVVAELDEDRPVEPAVLERLVRRVVLEELDCPVSRVVLVPRGWIVKTSSGKVARGANAEKLRALWQERSAPGDEARGPAPGEPWAWLLLRILVAVAVVALAVVLRPERALVTYRGF